MLSSGDYFMHLRAVEDDAMHIVLHVSLTCDAGHQAAAAAAGLYVGSKPPCPMVL
jgi:hypothetical protein